jgi:hypothetical protein
MLAGVLETQVSTTPGQPVSSKVNGNLAVLLEVQEVNGQKWQHILSSDGTQGWTYKPLGEPQATVARPVRVPFSLLSRSPDDPEFNSALELSIPPGSEAEVLGGSRASRPASPGDMMVPERLNRSIGPWLKLKVGASTGFAPADWVSLTWNYKKSQTASIQENLEQLGCRGSVRKPFLGPVMDALKTLAPPPGTTVKRFEADKSLASAVSPQKWDQPEMVVCSPEAKAAGIATLVVFSQDKSRLFTFIDSSGKASHVLMEEGSPYVSQAERADLNHDGATEWLLEVVNTFGDGYYSTLWVVNGKSATGELQIVRFALSRSSGEETNSAIDAAWWVGPDNRLWIVTAGKTTNIESFTCDGKICRAPANATQNSIVILFDGATYELAAQKRLELTNAGNPVGLFPMRSSGGLHWVVAQPFERLPEAQDWAKKKDLPATAIVALPRPPKMSLVSTSSDIR